MPKPIHTACIIDDDPAYVYLTKRIITIKKLCKNLLIYENGRIAMRELTYLLEYAEDFPELILLDINMPEMDGWEFLEAFTQLKPRLDKKVTIYMVSSSVDQKDYDQAKHYEDVTDYIVKPIDYDQLAILFGQADREPSSDGD